MIVNTHESTMSQVRMTFPDKCFQTYTTEAIGFSDAAEASLPIWHIDTQNARRAADRGEYQSIATEFIRRFR